MKLRILEILCCIAERETSIRVLWEQRRREIQTVNGRKAWAAQWIYIHQRESHLIVYHVMLRCLALISFASIDFKGFTSLWLSMETDTTTKWIASHSRDTFFATFWLLSRGKNTHAMRFLRFNWFCYNLLATIFLSARCMFDVVCSFVGIESKQCRKDNCHADWFDPLYSQLSRDRCLTWLMILFYKRHNLLNVYSAFFNI